MIDTILPATVAVVEEFGDPAGLTLDPAEERLIARAIPSRRAEFTTTRTCARRALERIGQPHVAILSGPSREPLWPVGVVGSLTHCDGYRAAAVARAGEIISLGIDAEPSAALPAGVLKLVASAEERQALAATKAEVPLDRVLFVAKESVYKAWFPLMRCWLGFEDAQLSISSATARSSDDSVVAYGTFRARLVGPALAFDGHEHTRIGGRWMATKTLIAAATVIEIQPRSDEASR